MPVNEVIDDPTCDEPHCDDPTDEVRPAGFALADLSTETPAPHRAHLTPTPASEHPNLDAPPAPTPTPPPVLDRERAYRDLTVHPEPIRVQVRSSPAGVADQISSGGGDASRLGAEPGGGIDMGAIAEVLVPDTQREAWVLDRLHDVAAEIRDYAAWIRPVHELVSDMRVLQERADARDEARVREERDRRTAELQLDLSKPTWKRALESPHASRAFGLATWLGGAVAGGVACGIADYLGLETEPVIRFFAQLLGAL